MAKMYVCKTLRLMHYLIRGGFECKKIQNDRNNPDYMVFLFEDSKELREYLRGYRKNNAA